jgi:hypothetical protein
MDVSITRTGAVQYYDAQRDGYDTTLIKNLSGTPSISNDKLLLNNVNIATFFACNNSRVEMILNFPASPATGDDKVFGLKGPNLGNRGATIFVIADDVFSAKVYDSLGTLLFSQVIPWNSAWNTTDTRFTISATERTVIFQVNDSNVALFGNVTEVPGHVFNGFYHGPLPVVVLNEDSDNLYVSAISIY